MLTPLTPFGPLHFPGLVISSCELSLRSQTLFEPELTDMDKATVSRSIRKSFHITNSGLPYTTLQPQDKTVGSGDTDLFRSP